jgi:hypothetical protein
MIIAVAALTAALGAALFGAGDLTGGPIPVQKTVVHGDIVVTQPGRVLDNLDVHGFVEVRAADVKITNSIVRGGQATGSRGLIRNTTPTALNLLIQDVVLKPEFPSVYIDGIHGGNFTARRVDISGTVDGIKIFRSNARVLSSRIHDLTQYQVDPAQGGGPSHNDGVQILGGSNVVVSGNHILGGNASAIQVTQSQGPVIGLAVSKNYFNAGACMVHLQHKPLSTLGPVSVTDNKFGPNGLIPGCAIVRTRATTLVESGNYWSDGSPFSVNVAG